MLLFSSRKQTAKTTCCDRTASTDGTVLPKSFKKRRGATAMEYLFVMSLIIVAALIAIQQIGGVASRMLSDSAEKLPVVKVENE